jgi:hypothetical protein
MFEPFEDGGYLSSMVVKFVATGFAIDPVSTDEKRAADDHESGLTPPVLKPVKIVVKKYRDYANNQKPRKT